MPGCGNSGPTHWQSRWEAENPSFRRVAQDDWMHPVRADWQARLEAAVARTGPETVLVAHSLGCLLVAHWAANTHLRVKAALLVAVPDPAGPEFPSVAIGFADPPARPLPFRSLIVASRDDPYGKLEHARACADAWGSELVDIGPAGHVNALSGLGRWKKGFALLQRLRA
ncbi:RBBP9/YdeN family alpha/beta hydrolase [Rudaea sp.]|uniref:RBBP9/YdeN family alpha/beta hydrolase n=1 Tax=Rudaea sp. TaxID=2136325 RepID=UPI002ED44F9E